ncbi:MlaC/ttg2D family ABC transporter substrate-binding protein [Pseudotabrizicola algicola]|uniref:ABC transporter substrate-binding protein n=1 Tax=Pseudotabrizicola algicola TaxID=2709381 RepID=A0A6B3RKN1_9RHOB|nr:ABC transporter substrate-binding protein [Pseudotabrizicola algicola]NEX45981.1 ABC transporter substrate-binding protein [Pseudotabrizicola algicola]
MANDRLIFTRRGFGIGLVGGAAALAMPLSAAALTVDQASALVGRAVADVNTTINSGKSAAAMYGDFERIFSRYADVPTIARSALGPAARGASAAQLAAFTTAYQGYMARKYGARFREFIGGQIEVTGARAVKSYFEVISVARLRGQAPFDVRWHVSDRSGKDLFFNIIIEGVNMLASERTEIGAMLDRRRGDINGLIEDMKRA